MSSVVLVGVPGVGIGVACILRTLDMLDMLGDSLGPVVCCGQIINWAVDEVGSEGKAMMG